MMSAARQPMRRHTRISLYGDSGRLGRGSQLLVHFLFGLDERPLTHNIPAMKFLLAACLLMALVNPAKAATDTLAFNDGDHISIVGNALADRMQHDGWFETLIQAHFPNNHLTIRNLGFAGDELSVRMRCENFGSPDDWLTRTKADIVFAFFGYNESFAGAAGLTKFKQDIEKFISNALEHQYNGRTAPQLVLFSPIAPET